MTLNRGKYLNSHFMQTLGYAVKNNYTDGIEVKLNPSVSPKERPQPKDMLE